MGSGWVARLREQAVGGPFLLWTDLRAGHRGTNGRYQLWWLESLVTGWLINAADEAT